MRTLLVSPIEPMASGNGLAMRAGMLLDSLARVGEVALAVVPLAGDLPESTWADERCGHRWRVEPDAADAVASVADQFWRAEMRSLEPRPARAGSAWPGAGLRLADEVRAEGYSPEVVVCLRSYLGPVAAAAATRLNARLIVDLDDDDVAMAGDADRPDWERLVTRVGAWADGIAAASPAEAEVISARVGRNVTVLPNVVAPVQGLSEPAPADTMHLLFVGNLTYAPNRDAAFELVDSILPRVDHAELTLVGSAHPDDARQWGTADRAECVGQVDDLEPYYSRCHVVVAPIRAGGGTRIKILEAMVHRRPVVATSAAVAGLAVENGVHLLVRDDTEGIASGIESLRDGRLVGRLTDRAERYVRVRHHPDRAAEIVARLIGAID